MNQDDFKRIQQTLQRLTTIVEQLTEGVVVTDLKGRIHFANPAFAQMHGYKSCQELMGKNITHFYLHEQAQDVFRSMINTVKNQGQIQNRIIHTRKHGSSFPALTKMALLKDDNKRVIGVTVLVTNLSFLKQRQQSLAGHIEQLESANGQLTEQLRELEQVLENNPHQEELFDPDDQFSQPLSTLRQLAEAKRHPYQKQPSHPHTTAGK